MKSINELINESIENSVINEASNKPFMCYMVASGVTSIVMAANEQNAADMLKAMYDDETTVYVYGLDKDIKSGKSSGTILIDTETILDRGVKINM